METKAVTRYVRVSPRKARVVADLIRGKNLQEAKQILEYTNRAAAVPISKTLASAQANAENNNKLESDLLYVSKCYVDEGPTLKRFRPRAYGRASRVNKRTSHITIVLDEREREGAKRRRVRRGSQKAKESRGSTERAKEKSKETSREETKSSKVKEASAKKAPSKAAKKPSAGERGKGKSSSTVRAEGKKGSLEEGKTERKGKGEE